MDNPIARIVRRNAWRQPARRIEILLDLAHQEAGAAAELASAAEACELPALKRDLLRHAATGSRHAEMFRAHAAGLLGTEPSTHVRRSGDFLSTRPEHSRPAGATFAGRDFLQSNGFHSLGALRYVAHLHVLRSKDALALEDLASLTRATDPSSCGLLDSIIRDEQEHVAYTRDQLDRWRREGRSAEVDRVLRQARWRRRRLELRRSLELFANAANSVVMTTLYVTVFLPLGIAVRLLRGRTGFVVPRRATNRTLADLEGVA